MHKLTQVTNTHSKLTVYPQSTHIHRYIKPKPNAYVGGKTPYSFLLS